MNQVVRCFVAAAWLAGGGWMSSLLAQLPSDSAVRVSAQVQASPPRIVLSWPGDSRSVVYSVARKLRDDTAWSDPVELGTNVTSFTDSNVVVGSAYEFRISKRTSDTYVRAGDGFIYAGAELPLMESRGKVVMVVDGTFTTALSNELARLQKDLAGDGWVVLRHDVPRMAVAPANSSSSVWSARSNELASVKALIKADYIADPVNVKAVFLFGHVPVPYSGDLFPDMHPEHQGAWPADGYYGDMDGDWTDSIVNRNTASDLRNRNVPGDGKFDRTIWPLGGTGRLDVELHVGRVDFANLPAFADSEGELLRRYLNKDHAYRHKIIATERRGLIDDNFGYFGGEAPAVNGWRNFAPFFGATNTIEGDWLSTSNSYLWGFGCGGGTYTSCSGVASTTQLAAGDPRVVFAMLHGSYFGDWDSQDNLLRASLATPGYTLASAWATRPHWYFHHMALGETIGFSTRVTQNNNGDLYPANGFQNFVHVALMGDPTLRMHTVVPPSGLVINTNGVGGVSLHWGASPEVVAGYHVYRAPTLAGPFVRLNNTLLIGTSYTDSLIAMSTYMVRAIKLEESASGSYFNASQGIFQDFNPPAALPLLIVTAQDKSKMYGEALQVLTASYSGFVNGDTPDSLDSPVVLNTPAMFNSPPGTYPIHVSGATDTNYVISFVDGTLTILRAATAGALTSSANPSLPGQPVAFTATLNVVAPGSGALSGTVQFRVNGQNAGSPISVMSGMASFTITNLGAGLHSVEAEYSGDTNFSGTTLALGQLVNTPPIAGTDVIERDATNGAMVLITTLLDNDSDADGDGVFFLEAGPTSANNGTVLYDNASVFYFPATGFTNADTFTYTISDGYSLSVMGLVTVNIRGMAASSPRLTISPLGGGAYSIRGEGIPGHAHQIQFLNNLGQTNWQSLGTAVTDTNGLFQFLDSLVATQRFYRSVFP